MKTLILIRGLPGSGKTSLVDFMQDDGFGLDFHSYSADDWMVDDQGEYKFDPNKLSQAHDQCQTAVEWDMSDGFNWIAVPNTFTTESELAPYYILAKRHGYKVISLIVENRHNGVSVHDVPESTITKMRNRFSVKL